MRIKKLVIDEVILLFGFSYDKKMKEHSCDIEKIVK